MSQWHAVEALDEAVDRTKKLLLPLRPELWLKLALVVLLANGLGGGGGGGGGGSGSDSSSTSRGSTFGAGYASLIGDVSAAADFHGILAQAGGGVDSFIEDSLSTTTGLIMLACAIGAILVLFLAFQYLSAVFRFVYVRSLTQGDVKIVEYFKKESGKGFSLFIFETVLLAVLVAVIVAAIVGGAAAFGGAGSGFAGVFLVVVAVAIFIFVLLAIILFMVFVNDFAVPVMYARGCGIIDGIGEAFSILSANFWQFVVFLLLSVALGVVSFIVIFVVSLVFLIVELPLGVAMVLGMAYLEQATMTPALMMMVVAGFIALFIIQLVIKYLITLVTLPISVFFRYYSLVFLKRVDPTLDLFRKTEEPAQPIIVAEGERVKVY
jgi:hypothetical protein